MHVTSNQFIHQRLITERDRQIAASEKRSKIADRPLASSYGMLLGSAVCVQDGQQHVVATHSSRTASARSHSSMQFQSVVQSGMRSAYLYVRQLQRLILGDFLQRAVQFQRQVDAPRPLGLNRKAQHGTPINVMIKCRRSLLKRQTRPDSPIRVHICATRKCNRTTSIWIQKLQEIL